MTKRAAAIIATILTAASVAAQERDPRTLAAAIPVAADGPLATASTQRTITVGGRPLSYRATWFETVLRDPAGVAQATISATAYVREGGARDRPVLVLFNGGPGASSSPLHFGAFGPRRLGERDAQGNRALLDNGETLLDVADLLFVDPVGTGFSRPLRPGGGAPYWTVAGDAAATLQLIRAWLKANGRAAAPLFVGGESYGGYRLGAMARDTADLNVAGLLLISPALDFGAAADQVAIEQLPTMAVAAWHRRKPAGDARTVAQVWEEARRFAQGDYAVALQQGHALDAASRDRMAARVAALIGLPVADVLAADLRVDSQRFLETLQPGSVVGRLDTRVAQPVAPTPLAPNRPAAANDPSLGLGRTNVIVSAPMGDYLRREIGVATTRDYYSLTLDVNFSWDWRRPTRGPGESWDVTPAIAALMKAKPRARLMLVGGYYDLATPLLAPRYALTHSDVPLDRTEMVAFAAGHSPFEGDANRAAGAARVRAFITGQ